MKAIAIDDEQSGLEVIKTHASKVPFLEVKAFFVDAFKALEYLQNEKIDLIFLDIKMPDMTGIEFYNSLNQKPLLIFTTAYAEHAAVSFEMDAVDYLLKPFSLTRFIKSCNKAYELHNHRNNSELSNHIFVKEGLEQKRIELDEILHLEASGNYVTYFLNETKIVSRQTLMEAINSLPQEKFIRIHRSFLVAIKKIEKFDRFQITVGGKRIPIGKAYKDQLNRLNIK